jgi:Flp pilus assembly protein TadD/transglutaminase-like putative cysteine protease
MNASGKFARVFTLWLLSAALVIAQERVTKPSQSEPDYSQEAFVLEKLHTYVRLEDDGTGSRTQEMRLRVISEAGVQQLGQLIFSYNAANENVMIDYVRVHKADGSIVTAGAEAVQDLSAPVAREAPVYTDLRQKHVTVPALRPGETLAYRFTTEIHTPLAPGQFWFEYDFVAQGVVLEETLELDVPAARKLHLKTADDALPEVREAGPRRIYRWSRSRPLPETEEQKQEQQKQISKPRPPAVQLTTFASWEEVGKWYAGLERERRVLTPELRTKAEELTGGRTTPREKIQALYDFVARQYRYVSLSFGVGRYQPHAAAEVLANQYGDCKDKHTLLAALAEAAGLEAYPVLIHSTRKLDPEVPSPAQFDHVISAVPEQGGFYFLDTTAEVAPFAMLPASLRGKQALLIPWSAPVRLVETPADPPFPMRQEVLVTGQISDLGRLEATLRYEMRGDSELGLRQAFRRTPQANWKDLVQWIATMDQLFGRVNEVKASDPEDTERPFTLEYSMAWPAYLDWSRKSAQLSLPVPNIGLPDANDETAAQDEPIELGSPLEITLRLELKLPAHYTARAPVPVRVTRDYAEYNSRYEFHEDTFLAERHLKLKQRKLPAARVRDYLAFVRALRADEGQMLAVESTAAGKPEIPETAKASELYDAGLAAYRNTDYRMAAALLERVVALEPEHKDAWNDLGLAYLALSELEKAEAAFRKQVEVNPFDEYAHNNLGRTLLLQQRYEEAEAAFKKQIEVNPLDRFAHANLGELYRRQRRYQEAAESLERAVTITPQNAGLHISLGQAYLNLGSREKALAAFEKGIELGASPTVWNNVAYELALHGLELDRAKQYAESAVAATAAGLRNTSLRRLSVRELTLVPALAAYWDTLGWVHFQQGDAGRAESYIQASWLLGLHGEVGDHLAQLLEKRGETEEAIRLYGRALAATLPPLETRQRLEALAGNEAAATAIAEGHRWLEAQRRIELGNIWTEPDDAAADFFVLLAPGPERRAVAEETLFVSGDKRLERFAANLRAVQFPQIFPDDTPTRLILRGTLRCTAETRACMFRTELPDRVTSVH